MDSLLAALRQAPRRTRLEHKSIPATPGIYAFHHQGRPFYVGQTRNLKKRLAQHTLRSATENQASFAYLLAMELAVGAGLRLEGTRKARLAVKEFFDLFVEAKNMVSGMEVQFIELVDPVERTLFEIYASLALGTTRFNSFETH